MLLAKVSMNGTFCVFGPPLMALEDIKAFLIDGGKGEDCKIEIVEM